MMALVNGKTFPATSLAQVSKAYLDTIAALGLGSSQVPKCLIVDRGRVLAHVSYNGRVWPGDPQSWTADLRPLYDPL